MNNTLTALNGVRVGHSTHLDKLTGCTVIVFDKPMTVAYKSYGGAVGSFNTEGLKSSSTMYGSNGLFIAGGSMTGLMSATPIMEAMRKNKIGMKISKDVYNPSLSGAIIRDLGVFIHPYDPIYGLEAFENVSKDIVPSGNVGAGTGASAGKFRWLINGTKSGAMKTGTGSARVDLGNGIIVCALSIVNPMGNVILPNGATLAGNRDETSKFKDYKDFQEYITRKEGLTNTTISVVGINVDLESIENYERIAHFAAQGQIRSIFPVNTSQDGDTVFVFSNADLKNPLNNMAKDFKVLDSDMHLQLDILGHAAAQAVQESIYDACRQAETIEFADAYNGIIPSSKDY